MRMISDLDKLALDQSVILLSELEAVKVISDWVPVNEAKSAWLLQVQLSLPNEPANDLIPQKSDWSIIADFENDKWGKIDIYPALEGNSIKQTFTHQMYNGDSHITLPVRSGNICTSSITHGLALARKAFLVEPKNTANRIIWHVERALDWLEAAVNDRLSVKGDHFEMPDFNTGMSCRDTTLAYVEDADSFSQWGSVSDKFGIASISRLSNTIFIQNFMDDKSKKTLIEVEWGYNIRNLNKHKALWIRLDDIPVLNGWQAPSTFEELCKIIEFQRRDFLEIIKKLMNRFADVSECLLLLGFPIPNKIGENPYRYHWQAMVLSPISRNIRYNTIRAQLTINHLKSKKKIIWFHNSQNWHSNNLKNRGKMSDSLIAANVILIGCGSFGSISAEQLVRMGLKNLIVVDNKIFEPGNLVRHTLDITHLGKSKAIELAERLNKINPLATVTGLPLAVPNNDSAFADAIRKADIILDFTADDNLLNELPLKGVKPSAIIVSCSVGLNANRLFFYSDSSSNFSSNNFNEYFQGYREEEHKLAQKEDLPRGAGCWHPVVPAKLNRIAGLSGVAVELIEQAYEDQSSLPAFVCHEWTVPDLKEAAKKIA